MRTFCTALTLFLASSAWGDDFVPLFNGRDLDGWKERQVKKGQENRWSVEAGVLKASPGSGWLGTNKQYGDFVLRVEWKIVKNGNSGVFIRVPDTEFKGSPSDAGFEIQILDDEGDQYKDKLKPYQYCGGLYHFLPVNKPLFKSAGAWQTYEIAARGDRITLEFNSERAWEADIRKNAEMKKRPRKGFIGLQNHGTAVEFRKVEIKELSGNE